VDEGGVALAAIQGLNQKLEAENAQLRGKLDEAAQGNSAMQSRLDALADRVDRLEAARER